MPPDIQPAIVRHLKQHGDSTVSEISAALGRSTVTVRHHLAGLLQARVAEVYSRHLASGPGRPEKAYRLTSEAAPFLPTNFEEMACLLVEQLDQTVPQAELARLLGRSGHQLADRLAQGWPEDPPGRRHEVIDVFASRGYFPSWSVDAGTDLLRLGHCPYSSAAARVPALCVFDASLLEGLLGCQVRLERSIAEGAPECEFRPVDTFPA